MFSLYIHARSHKLNRFFHKELIKKSEDIVDKIYDQAKRFIGLIRISLYLAGAYYISINLLII